MAAEIVDRCRRSRVAFSLAIDGAGELHDSIRGVKGNFGALLETYKLLVEIRRRERRFSINLNTVLMDRNIGHLDELMRFVSDNMPDADFHGFEVLRGSPPEKDLRPPTPEQYREALRKLIPYWARFPFYRGPLRRLLRAAKIEARLMELEALKGIGPDMPCHAGRISCVIDALGDLYFCEELTTPIGNLRDLGYDFGKLWYSEESERLRRFVAEKGCRCTHSCFLGSSLMFEPRYYGRLLRRVMITSRYKL
jgi:radical SAM protein with 4Fe4S-binding SPASM domain